MRWKLMYFIIVQASGQNLQSFHLASNSNTQKTINKAKKHRQALSITSTPSSNNKPHPELHQTSKDGLSDGSDKRSSDDGGNEYPDLDPFEGAKLVRGTFRIFEKTAKVTADALRIFGDTTAGVGGSGIKVVGTAVKTVGSMLETSAETAMERESSSKLAHATRRVAGHSVIVLSTLVKGVGESFMLAGQATESVTSGTAGVAEDTIRVVEELFGTFADHFHDESSFTSSYSSSHSTTSSSSSSSSSPSASTSSSSPSDNYFSYSSNQLNHEKPSFLSLSFEDPGTSIIIIASILKAWVLHTIYGSLEDVVGVSSVIPQIALSYFFLFVLSAWLRGRAIRRTKAELLEVEEEEVVTNMGELTTPTPFNTPVRATNPTKNAAATSILHPKTPTSTIHHHHHHHHNSDPGSPPYITSVVAEKIEPPHPSFDTPQLRSPAPALQAMNRVERLKRPRRSLIRRFVSFFVSPGVISLWTHLVLMLFVARSILMNSNKIKRAAETKGFRDAINSVTQKGGTAFGKSIPAFESAIWANNLLDSLWRVEVDDIDYTACEGGYEPDYDMNDYVRRSIVKNTKLDETQKAKQDENQGGDNHRGREKDFEPLLYGGLEPYLSTTISSVVALTLDELATQPDSSAYLSLHSFTLGSKPPLIRGLRINPAGNGTLLEASFDVDFVSTDLEIILKLKLSSSDYAILPTSMISITDLDTRIPIRVVFEPSKSYPFSGPLEISVLGDCCDVGFKLLPLSKSSGMQGVDLNSLPLLSSWIKEGLQSSLAALRSPNYVRFDLAKYLSYSTFTTCQNYGTAGGRGGGVNGEGSLLLVTGEEKKSLRDAEDSVVGGEDSELLDDAAVTKAENDHLGKKLTRILEVEILGIGNSNGDSNREVGNEGINGGGMVKKEERKGFFGRKRRIVQRKIKNPLVIMVNAMRQLLGKVVKVF